VIIYIACIPKYELEVKDTTDTHKSASYLDLQIEIDNGGSLKTKHYDIRNDFNFPIVNFPFIISNISASITSVWSLHFTIHTLF